MRFGPAEESIIKHPKGCQMRLKALVEARMWDGSERFTELAFVNGMSSSAKSSLSSDVRLRYSSFVSTGVIW